MPAAQAALLRPSLIPPFLASSSSLAPSSLSLPLPSLPIHPSVLPQSGCLRWCAQEREVKQARAEAADEVKQARAEAADEVKQARAEAADARAAAAASLAARDEAERTAAVQRGALEARVAELEGEILQQVLRVGRRSAQPICC